MKRYFHEELEEVRSHLMLMGEKAIANVNLAMKAMIDSDLATAQKVRKQDDRIDEIEKQIDDEVARYIGLRAPVARDLRLLFITIKAANDLERVGDEATSIAKRTAKILKAGYSIDDLGRLPRMCELAVGMLKDALHCFIDEDSSRAVAISERDEEVDSLNRENFRYFVDLMKHDHSKISFCTEMVFISKAMERIADHAQNIAEEVYYLLTARSLQEAIDEENAV
ncbi:phosphate signaling complex protein PhoU [Pelagicoccus mobilis]|uniref:Phosphate-specific transport system accessory protein PhoU n=1 Tax=Pelagicoccus mobilis TaxID=415221 RepID=A0A934VR94_9BACT|nr:phosphate signaling complex protein PhoU [Pelagicoccus mobilis]MBK1877388.1 phosphate signaling complex protein PhoU [Pelagicoccus mobilis]